MPTGKLTINAHHPADCSCTYCDYDRRGVGHRQPCDCAACIQAQHNADLEAASEKAWADCGDPQAIAEELGVPKDAPALALLAAAVTKLRARPTRPSALRSVEFAWRLARELEIDPSDLVAMPIESVLQRLRHKVVEG